MRDWIHLVRVLWNDLDPTADPTTLACSHVPLLLHVHMCLPLACSHVPILIVYTVCATGKSPPPPLYSHWICIIVYDGDLSKFSNKNPRIAEEMGGGLFWGGGPSEGVLGGGIVGTLKRGSQDRWQVFIGFPSSKYFSAYTHVLFTISFCII